MIAMHVLHGISLGHGRTQVLIVGVHMYTLACEDVEGFARRLMQYVRYGADGSYPTARR